MQKEVKEFIGGKRYAILGVSRAGNKFGNMVFTEMKQRGYQMYIVHPEAAEIQGETCYPNMAALPEPVDGVIINVMPRHTAQAVRDAVSAGINRIWIQQGAESPEALAAAQELGVTPVTKKCILMYAEPVKGFHSIHRFFAKLFGQM